MTKLCPHLAGGVFPACNSLQTGQGGEWSSRQHRGVVVILSCPELSSRPHFLFLGGGLWGQTH